MILRTIYIFKRNVILSILTSILFGMFQLSAQVGINTTNPNALLDITAGNSDSPKNTDGILIPRLNKFPDNLSDSQNGMLIFLNQGTIENPKGFYWRDSSNNSWNTFRAKDINSLSDGKTTLPGNSIFLGKEAGLNTSGRESENIGLGYKSFNALTTGSRNVGVGYESLKSNTSGLFNVALGAYSLTKNINGLKNTAIGYKSLTKNINGVSNTAIGANSLRWNYSGGRNTAVGANSLRWNSSGNYNLAVGYESLYNNSVGHFNTAVGYQAGYNNFSGNLNVFLGYQAGYHETGSFKLYIDNSDTETPLIYGDFLKRKVGINTKNLNHGVINSPCFVIDDSGANEASNTPNLYDYSLYVKGGVLTEELTVASGWADYVFEPDYKLKTLKSVKNFIDKNGHLPNVPSAKTIQKSGLQVGDMMRIQQEKIEELTLYLISQENLLSEQQIEIDKLYEKVFKLASKK